MANRLVWGGRYAVFDEIASGGMASVFLACRLGAGESGRVVAIKKLFEQFAKQPEFVTMFLDEAHIAARIRHPNVVTTYEFLRVPDSLAIVMDFVLGAPLVDLARVARDRHEVAPPRVTAAIVCDALEGLHAAHESMDERGRPFGLVHRDVSPHNILVGKDGRGRVIDFGIAKAAGRLQVTEVGVMKGKFAYMAPEQIRAGAVDRRSDVYSTGIVLWEALAGRPLFRGSADAELFSKRGDGKVNVGAPSLVNADISPELDEVVLRALEVDPDRRFSSAREMSEALQEAAGVASEDEVAAWVADLLGDKVRELERKRNEVETSFASGELSGLVPAALADTVTARGAPTPSTPDLDIPDLLPPKAVVKQARASAPASQRVPPPTSARSATNGDGFDDVVADVKLDLAMPMSSPAPRSRSSHSLDGRSLDARAGADSARASVRHVARSPRRGGGVLFVIVLLVALGAVGWKVGPTLVKASLVDAAARRGFVLSVDDLEPRSGGLTLTGVTLTLANVGDVTVKAPSVDVDLDWQGGVRKIFAPGFDLAVRGSATDLGKRLADWRSAPHLPASFEGKAGHLLWSDVLVPGVRAEGIDVSLAVGSQGEGSVHAELPSLTLSLARGSLGPWGARLDSTSEETKLVIALDRTKVDGPPQVSFVVRPSLGVVLSATIPRAKTSQIGVPADFVHGGADPEIELALEGQVLPTGQPLTAHARLGFFAVPIVMAAGALSPVDLVLEGSIAGDTTRALPIDPGSLSIGKVKTRVLGDVTFAPEGVRIEVDRPSGKAPTPPPPFVFDTRDWTSPAVDTVPVPKPVATTPSAAPSGRHR